jgi:hypothetical protein
MTGSVAGTALCALAQAALFGTSVDLLEHIRHDAEKGDNEASEGEEEADCLP